MSTTIQNKIQIKRGNSAPTVGILDEGEPGYDLKNKRLYIGNGEDDSVLPTCFPNSKEVVFQGEDVEDGGRVMIDADSLNGHSASDFAPAGYGLGMERATTLTTQAQVDALRAFGVHEYYGSESACEGIPNITQGSILTIPTMYGVTQFFFVRYLGGVIGGCYLKRMSYVEVTSGWNPWEWVNPPMVPDVEYRTTERYNGKPVYVKLIDFGTLPNTSYKNVLFYSNDTSRPISVVGQCGTDYNSLNMSIPSSSNGVDIFAVNYSQIRAITTHDASGQYARVLVKYWKTTD